MYEEGLCSTAHFWFPFWSVMDASDADDEGSSSESEELPAVDLSDEESVAAVDLSDESSSSEAEEPAVDLSDEESMAAVDLFDESSSSEAEGPAVDLSDESVAAVDLSDESSSSEESGSSSEKLVHNPQTPPLVFPASPASHEAVLDDAFNMEGYDQQSDIISGWYTTEEEV